MKPWLVAVTISAVPPELMLPPAELLSKRGAVAGCIQPFSLITIVIVVAVASVPPTDTEPLVVLDSSPPVGVPGKLLREVRLTVKLLPIVPIL